MPTTDPVQRTRQQLAADLIRTTLELEGALIRRDEDEIAELQRERRWARNQLASLDMSFA